MNENLGNTYKWSPLAVTLPSKDDFDPYGDGDAEYAWNEFGGMSLDDAYAHFLENPEGRQEDFLFMGPRAFLFYFPVLERYLIHPPSADEWSDSHAWILGQVLVIQLGEESLRQDPTLRSRIAGLSSFVRKNLSLYALKEEDRARIDASWDEVERKLT